MSERREAGIPPSSERGPSGPAPARASDREPGIPASSERAIEEAPRAGSVSERPSESKGIAFTNWLVRKTSGLLERKTSRRGFLVGSAMAGSAVAVAGIKPITQVGTLTTFITDCPSGTLCTDGYTEFCCAINNGLNSCPPNSFPGGWWRADFSTFCNGTRYYVDCMQNCCGPPIGGNFCAGCVECQCANGCDTRRVYCNYFRYGQCHQEIVQTGPIACRVVTCTPPYADPNNACTADAAVDNATAEHQGNCPPPPPQFPPPLPFEFPVAGAAASPLFGQMAVLTRDFSSRIGTRIFNGSSWSPWTEVNPGVNSGLGAASDVSGLYVVGRGNDNYVWSNRYTGGAWQGQRQLSGLLGNSNPKVFADSDGVHVMIRSVDKAFWYGRFVGGTWTGWRSLRGNFTFHPTGTSSGFGRFAFGRGSDGHLWFSRQTSSATDWTAWSPLEGSLAAGPTACSDGSGIYVFVVGTDNNIWYRKFTGSWGPWISLHGNTMGQPYAVATSSGPFVFVRGIDGRVWCNRSIGGSWTGFQPLPGSTNASPVAAVDGSNVYVFVRGTDNGTWYAKSNGGAFSGFTSLGGVDVAVDANPF